LPTSNSGTAEDAADALMLVGDLTAIPLSLIWALRVSALILHSVDWRAGTTREQELMLAVKERCVPIAWDTLHLLLKDF
jgi:hypothetical protein